jgi:hypothetical protein
LALGKAPFSATFRPFFDGFLRVFSVSLRRRAQIGAIVTLKSADWEPRPIAGLRWELIVINNKDSMQGSGG